MGVDATAVANVLGITTTFKDLRAGGVFNLPQQIALFVQGNSDAVYSTTKFLATSAGQVANKMGFGSPAHRVMRRLRPANGDGVGTVPITIYPLVDDASGVAAAGALTPVGTQTKQAAYQLSVSNQLSLSFVVPVGAGPTKWCQLAYDALVGVLEMPVKAGITYGPVVASALSGTGNGTCTALSVAGGQTPVPGDWVLELVTAATNGGTWKLTDPKGRLVSSTLLMTAGVGVATVFTNVGGITFTITDGTTDFAVGAKFTITVPASAVTVTSKWKGASANALKVSLVGDDYGITVGITQPTGGLVNPSIAAALAQIGGRWETMVLNQMNIDDTATLDLLQTEGEGRWGTLRHRPFVAFTGNTIADMTLATVVSAARRTDRINAQLVAPGSSDLPFEVAAQQLARIAVMANNNPATGYASLQCPGITAGADGVQWDYPTRDAAVKLGSSTTDVVDGVVQIQDVVTFYRPTDEDPPAYRKVVSIVKLQNFIANIHAIFASTEWASAPLIPDSQVTDNPRARKPRHALAAVRAKIDGLGRAAIVSDPKTIKKNTSAAIDTQNPDRINVLIDGAPISGNSDVKDIGINWGFAYGVAVPLAA